MVRIIILNALFFGTVGGISTLMGYPYNTWQFWAIMGCMMGVYLNGEIG